jgi:ATP-dependent Clp protease ATP-binding subunit ClpA
VVLIMTTNAGAQEMARPSIGFTEQDNAPDGMEAIKRLFSPEFRNRLDSVIQFEPLGTDVIKTVVDKFLTELQAQLDAKKVQLEVDDEARAWLAREGYDVKMGARPMQRLIQEKIKRSLAEEVLFGPLAKNGGTVYVTVEDGDLKVRCEAPESAAPEPA